MCVSEGRGRTFTMTSEDTPMTPAAPVVDERQKALDKYKEKLLKHRSLFLAVKRYCDAVCGFPVFAERVCDVVIINICRYRSPA